MLLAVLTLIFNPFAGIFGIQEAEAAIGEDWVDRLSPKVVQNSWSSIIWADGKYVAVGNQFVGVSSDGVSWNTERIIENPSDGYLYGVAYGNSVFVAVGSSGTVLTSPDGITWTARTAAEANYWTSVTYGNGLFVAVANSGTNRVMTSPDGITWTARTAPAKMWRDLIYANNIFVAVAGDYGGTQNVMTSPDGVTWTSRTAPSTEFISVTYGNGLFVAVGFLGSGTKIASSPDGITWATRRSTGTYRTVVYANGLFTATHSNNIATSPDGITWTDYPGTYPDISSIVYRNGSYVAAGAIKTGFHDSTDSLNWYQHDALVSDALFYTAAYGDGKFVGMSDSGTSIVSSDGVNWAPGGNAVGINNVYGLVYGNGLFVATGFGKIATSADGMIWTVSAAPQNQYLNSVVYGNGTFVAVSNSGTDQVITSPDGITWISRSVPEANSWRSVTYGNGLFVSVASSGTNRVMTSPDGITWTARTAAAVSSWNSVTYGNGLFVAVALNGTDYIMTSPDGITWTAPSVPAADFRSVTYGNGMFVAAGTNILMTSPDGITWTSQSAPAKSWRAIISAPGSFVALGLNGAIMTSGTITSADSGMFSITQEITGELSFGVPPTNITLSNDIAGLTGGTATGTTPFSVTSNNPTGHQVTIEFSAPTAMNHTEALGTIPNYTPTTPGTPDYLFTLPANTAAFAYTVHSATSSLDIAPNFLNNGSTCNTGTTSSLNTCWYNQADATMPTTLINSTTPTHSNGNHYSLDFQVQVDANVTPALPTGFYVATATLTVVLN